MPDVDERLDELQKQVDAERKAEAELGKDIDDEARQLERPTGPGEDVRGGGVI
jgi:hypothetical protein